MVTMTDWLVDVHKVTDEEVISMENLAERVVPIVRMGDVKHTQKEKVHGCMLVAYALGVEWARDQEVKRES